MHTGITYLPLSHSLSPLPLPSLTFAQSALRMTHYAQRRKRTNCKKQGMFSKAKASRFLCLGARLLVQGAMKLGSLTCQRFTQRYASTLETLKMSILAKRLALASGGCEPCSTSLESLQFTKTATRNKRTLLGAPGIATRRY